MDLSNSTIFAGLCRSQGFPVPVFEHLFAKEIGRKWRFDVAFIDQKIAVEWEGITWYGNKQSRHQSAKGFEGDCTKYREAALLGWVVLRYTQRQQDRAIDDLKRAFKLRAGR